MKIETCVAVLKEKVANIEEKISDFVTKDEFGPVKIIAFGLIGLMAVAVVAALMNMILK